MNNTMMGGGLLPGSVTGILDLDSVSQRHPPAKAGLHAIPSATGLDPDHQMGSLFGPSPGGAATSDDEDHFPGSGAGDENGCNSHSHLASGAGGSKKASPWQRMKWTDEVVRLLISVVAHVGDHDDDTPDTFDGSAAARRKHGPTLQKKGKWKKVSELMFKQGYNVSPQQCEDKFNDLNKRYKRLNEILGRGTSCQVVENPLLLDSMQISLKAKDDVRKILSSKHLFYREMCAYHNEQRIPNCHDANLPVPVVPKVAPCKDGNGPVDDEEEDEDEDDDNGDHDEGSDDMGLRDFESFKVEMDTVLQNPKMSLWEQREWFKRRALQLEEEKVEIDAEALVLEKRHFKWQRFRSKKDRELERLRLENERLSLENERMRLHVRQKELELDLKRSRDPLDSASLRMDGEQIRDPMDLAMAP